MIKNNSNDIFNGLVSVIVNCYNGEKYLTQCIDSILSQTYENLEIIFWDNKSNDNTSSIINKYQDKRIKYFFSKQHTNLYYARREAIKKTKGEFIAFLDVDDYWLKNNLEYQIKLFEDQEVGFVSSDFLIKFEEKNKFIYSNKYKHTSEKLLSSLLKSYNIGLLTLIIRKSSLENLGFYFDSNYHYIGDFDMVIRLSSLYKMGRTNKYLSVYRIHKNNESSKGLDMQINEMEIWYSKMQNINIISKDVNFKFIYYKILYMKGMKYILKNQRIKVLYYFFQMPNIKMKYKLFLALFIPLSILKRLKNYSAI